MSASAGEPVAAWARLAPLEPLVRVGDDAHAATVMRVALPSVTRSASLARGLVDALLEARGIDERSRNDLVLAISEASSNAIEYGTGPCVDVCVEVDHDGCLMSVGNAVDQLVSFEGAAMPPAVAMRGRGIAIIDAVMDEVAFQLVDERCVVEMYRRLAG